MVHVTKLNFLSQLTDFLHHLPTSSFIALDEEMTGISLPETRSLRPNKVELPSERYTRLLKGVPERYSILQVGVSLFHKNPNYKPKGKDDGAGSRSSAGGVMNNSTNDEHAYMHREGMLNEDELMNVTEREEEEEIAAEAGANDEEEEEGEEQSEYTSRIYNFYLFPNGKTPNEREVTMNPSTVKFLLENNMDFHKVFSEGISYTTVDHAKYLKQKYFEKYHANMNNTEGKEEDGDEKLRTNGHNKTPRKGGRVKLTRVEDIAFVARTMAELREWIDADITVGGVAADNTGVTAPPAGNLTISMNGTATNIDNSSTVVDDASRREEGTSLLLPPCNAFLRRCLYETIEDEYPGLILERADSDPNAAGTTAASRNQIRAIRLSPTEKKRREKRLRQEEWDKILMNIGFTTLFQAISAASNGETFTKERTSDFLDGLVTDVSSPTALANYTGKKIPLIIHNGLQDLLFLLTHCHDATLPESFENTKRTIQKYFPLVYDTKVLATEYSDAIIKGGSSTLGELYSTTCADDGDLDDKVLMKVPPIINQDGRSCEQAHEAAWDAYMTGCVFNALSNRILEANLLGELDLDVLLHDSSYNHLLRDYIGLNKIYNHASIYTIDLESISGPAGLHDPLSRGLSIDTTFNVSGITTSVSTRDIFQALTSGNESEEEVIRSLKYEIIWIDDISFFVGIRMVDDISTKSISLIASHVRNKLLSGLGGNVKISALDDYLKKNYNIETPEPSGIVGLVSAATKPLQVLFGFGKKRSFSEQSNDSSANKRRRLG